MRDQNRLAVSVAEAAQMLGVSRPTMYQILNREDFKGGFRVGAKWLISVQALQDWIERQTKATIN